MKSAFNTSKPWKIPRALSLLCSGLWRHRDRDVITNWIADRTSPLPLEHQKNRGDLEGALDVFTQAWPDFAEVKLHPVVWLWFGLDRARARLHPQCLAMFVDYIETSLESGYQPILRRDDTDVAATRRMPALVGDDGEVLSAVLVATLPYRPFDIKVAAQAWRSDAQRIDVPKPVREDAHHREGLGGSDSPRCVAALEPLLSAMADRGHYVERLRKPEGTVLFRSLGAKRPKLIELLSAGRGGASLDAFADSTKLRAMSAIVRCGPGPEKLVIETAARRRKGR